MHANVGMSDLERPMGASRQFVDSFGFSWQVIEIARDTAATDEERDQGWLYFLSRGTTRRLRAYPLDWPTMHWTELEDLCTSAEVVGTDAGSRPVRAFSERLRASSR
jgi:hypothetical protein